MENIYNLEVSGPEELSERLRCVTMRMRKQLVRDIANRVRPAGSTIDEINRYYGTHFEPCAYNILILRAILKEKSEKNAPKQLLQLIQERMRESLVPVFNDLETAIVDGRIVCLFNITTHRDSPSTEAFKLVISRFFAEISTAAEFSEYDFIMGEGTTVESVLQLDQCYISAVQAIEYGVIFGLNKKYDSYTLVKDFGNIMSILTTERRNRLRYCTETLNREKMQELLDELFSASEKDLVRSPGLAYLLPHKILDLCSAAIAFRAFVPFSPEQHISALPLQGFCSPLSPT